MTSLCQQDENEQNVDDHVDESEQQSSKNCYEYPLIADADLDHCWHEYFGIFHISIDRWRCDSDGCR